jgi:hypothetical protein
MYPGGPLSDTGGWKADRSHPQSPGDFRTSPGSTRGFPPSRPRLADNAYLAPVDYLAPVEPMGRPISSGRGDPAARRQWDPPDDEPGFDPPDRRWHRGGDPSDRTSRHDPDGEASTRRTRPWMTALGLVAVAVLVAVCAAGGYLVFTAPGSGGSGADRTPGALPHDITSRRTDAAPLSEAELFPAASVANGYQLLKSQALTDCRSAAVGEPVKMLPVQDCSQVVRGALLSADQAFVVTVGLFNFGTEVNAKQASESIRDSVGAQKGRFTGFNLGTPPSDVYARAATQLGWDIRGHFLAYCVIARADGKAIDGDDPTAHQIINDLVEKYLIGTVLQARVYPPSPVPPAGSAPAKPSFPSAKPSARK